MGGYRADEIAKKLEDREKNSCPCGAESGRDFTSGVMCVLCGTRMTDEQIAAAFAAAERFHNGGQISSDNP